MAQNARIAALTDELVQSILQVDPRTQRHAYQRAREAATRGLRGHQYARTNQFDVQASYAGLDEKFRVLNRDDLADALTKRVKEINQRSGKWIPEYLALLLLLSDRPTENSKVEALELLRPPEPPPQLTWRQILEDDPYSDEEIWHDIDYAVESSEDEATPRKREKAKAAPVVSVDEDDTYDLEGCVLPVDESVLENLSREQFWTRSLGDEVEKVDISELQAIRETLFMLAGLRTSLYHSDKQHDHIRINHKFVLSHAMQKTADHVLVQLADIGRQLYRLRHWAERSSSLPLIQTFEAAVTKRLADYDRSLSLVQQSYVAPGVPVAVSLLGLHDEIRTMSRPILALADLVAEIDAQLLVNPFIHLETLFNRISLAQMMLEKDVFDFLSSIFFECLQTYLKPIRRWMEEGELGLNDETFFVFEHDPGSEASSLWHDRFVLRRGKENVLRSPSFLQPAAQKIFNTGKSVVLLKELGIHGASLSLPGSEPRLAHETVCGSSSEISLSPFSELFQSAFQAWISSKYSLASTILRGHIFSECGLMRVLDDFKTLYLCADGSAFQDFADAIFERMDTDQRGWNDRFLLTELARGIFSNTLTRARAERVVVRSVRCKTVDQSVTSLANVYIDYVLPWPIMNIIQRSSIPIYQQIFALLLQTYRTKYLLQRVPTSGIRKINILYLRQLSYKLRQRLVWFADLLRSHLTETVVDLSTQDMVTAMVKAKDIDEMSNVHIKYVARLQDQALLSENLKPIHKAIVSMLDLALLYSQSHRPDSATSKVPQTRPVESVRKTSTKATLKASRRKSFIPAIVENESSDSDNGSVGDDEQVAAAKPSNASDFEGSLITIDKEFERLLRFVVAGLRSVGRVGAEPVWEMLAERLEWNKRKDGV